MKKIIALAVASAFVAPAMAADVTVEGSIEYFYYSGDKLKADAEGTAYEYIGHNDNSVIVSATEEVNGITVTGQMGIVDDSNGNDSLEQEGSKLTLAGPFGKLGLGDNSGAIDAVGDYTDVASLFGGFAGDGDDAAFLYTLPSMAGLTINLSYSPEDGSFVGDGSSVSSDSQGFSAKYSLDPIEVYYGAETIADTDSQAYGLKASFNGVMFAAEYFTEDGKGTAAGASGGNDKTKNFGIYSKDGGDIDGSSYALTYTIGDVKIGGEMHTVEEKDNATKLSDLNVYFAEYNLGSNVDIYVSYFNQEGVAYYENATKGTLSSAGAAITADDYKAAQKGSGTAIGVEYNF